VRGNEHPDRDLEIPVQRHLRCAGRHERVTTQYFESRRTVERALPRARGTVLDIREVRRDAIWDIRACVCVT
jgi:hypothetical protein